MFDAYVFDCDGTILDTLPDLVAVTNQALAQFGMPAHTRDEVLSYVGNGAKCLIDQAVAPGTSDELAAQVLQCWIDLYPQMGLRLTRPFPGIPEVLEQLRAAGAKLAVVSNKYDQGTRDVCDLHLPGLFDAVHGEGPGFPRKPDPTGLLRTLRELNVEPERAAYVGDSAGDMQVALAAGCRAVGVAWGYNPAESLSAAGAQAMVQHARELLAVR